MVRKSETFIGEILGPRRKEIVLATKFGGMALMNSKTASAGEEGIYNKCIDASLKRLRTDYVDLYQMHYPDPNTPIEETLGVLNDLVKQGKVRAIGHSNFSGAQIDESAAQAKAKSTAAFVTAQNEWSLLNRAAEQDVIPACDRQHLGQLPSFRSPMASYQVSTDAEKLYRLAVDWTNSIFSKAGQTMTISTRLKSLKRLLKVEATRSWNSPCRGLRRSRV